MFSKRQSHFKSVKELRDLHPLLNELRNKNRELKELVDNNAGNQSYKKSIIITNLCVQLDEIIIQFDCLPVAAERIIEINNILILISFLQNAISSCLEKHRAVLNQPRPTLTHRLSQNSTEATLVGSVALGFASGSFLLAGVPLLGGVALEYGLTQLGFNKPITASVSILERLLNKLETIHASLSFTLDELKNTAQETVVPSAPLMDEETMPVFKGM
ncbi:hypothetical protein J2N86_08645 [Legionella lytica]|uniref:Substrate of the Dot/Icm secretion system n=1 Tax=Legionella lytica TaxID=96232 RepID=A0ABY4Y5C1_9GAMM|nr:hypothetical protein [Legionella lytica]USQ12775.1 hypothetical protein J2N86_08645 [Legionella lytica]